MLVRQTNKQASTVSHRPAFKLPWMLMSINFPLQLCIDPNCVCPAKAHILVKVAGFHLEAPRPRNQLFSHDLQQGISGLPQERLCSHHKNWCRKASTNWLPAEPLCRFQTYGHQLDQVNYIFICFHARKEELPPVASSSPLWHIMNHAHRQGFTQICHRHWHPLSTEKHPIFTCQCPNYLIYEGTKR